jgi:hypothetical protein
MRKGPLMRAFDRNRWALTDALGRTDQVFSINQTRARAPTRRTITSMSSFNGPSDGLAIHPTQCRLRGRL